MPETLHSPAANMRGGFLQAPPDLCLDGTFAEIRRLEDLQEDTEWARSELETKLPIYANPEYREIEDLVHALALVLLDDEDSHHWVETLRKTVGLNRLRKAAVKLLGIMETVARQKFESL